jgi:hypothetical protein
MMPKKWIALLILTILLIGGTGYLYVQQPEEETSGVLINPEGQPSSSLPIDELEIMTREIALFIGDPLRGTLVRITSEIQDQQDIVQEITETMQQLIHPGPNTKNEAIPEGTELINVFVTSLVNTLLFNFKEIQQVQILVEGAEIDTLAGHIDCRKPFSKMLSQQNL